MTDLDPVARWYRLRERPHHLVVGLISGTSADGVDAALVRLEDLDQRVRVETLSHVTCPYPKDLAERILGAAEASARDLSALDALIGRLFAAAALEAIDRGGATTADVDLIGSHGQTICHTPPRGSKHGTTLQIGHPAVIAQGTGLTVVSDFRMADMAAGGQGAPLVPFADHMLLSQPGERRVILNIGGIANLTATAGEFDGLVAFDTGPGNALLDSLVRITTGGTEAFDRDGARSREGRVDDALLADLMAHPYLRQPPPKSVDREMFGYSMARRLLAENAELPFEDLLATAAAFTVDSILLCLEQLPERYHRLDRIIVSGGGVYNEALMARLRARAAPVPVETSDRYGISADAKEAIAFALLARETTLGRSANVPVATGATRRLVLGSVTFGPGC